METFEINDTLVTSQLSMKTLGLTFQHDMKWNSHVRNIFIRGNPKLSMLKKLRVKLNANQFLKNCHLPDL